MKAGGVLWLLVCIAGINGIPSTPESLARSVLNEYHTRYAEFMPRLVQAAWDYYTNITNEGKAAKDALNLERAQMDAAAASVATAILRQSASILSNETRYELEKIAKKAQSSLGEDSLVHETNTLRSKMRERYFKGRVCLVENETYSDCLPLKPDLLDIMRTSRDQNERLAVWNGWRDSVGKPAKEDFAHYVELNNKRAKQMGYENYADYQDARYNQGDAHQEALRLLEQLQPAWNNLHAFVRRHLHGIYGDLVNLKKPIPAHLLGDVWSTSWSSVAKEAIAPNESFDLSKIFMEKGFTGEQMFRLVHDYFVSVGFQPLPDTFWENSIMERPRDGRDLSCVPSHYDFHNGEYRVVMCTEPTGQDFFTIFDLMGKVFSLHETAFDQSEAEARLSRLQNKNSILIESLGDTLAMAFLTPENLKHHGLLDADSNISADVLRRNHQLSMSLDNMAFLPFAFVVEEWRRGVYNGSITPDQYNDVWWELRSKYEGIVPQDVRPQDSFDAAALYHVIADLPYFKYLFGYFTRFQLLDSLCGGAGNETNAPCNLTANAESGAKLRTALKQSAGKEEDISKTLSALTGKETLDAGGVAKFFQSLHSHVEKTNIEAGEQVGWERPPPPHVTRKNNRARKFISRYNERFSELMPRLVYAAWDYYSNITDYNREIKDALNLERLQFETEARAEAMELLSEDLDDIIRRQIEEIIANTRSQVGDDDLTREYTRLRSDFKEKYYTSKACRSELDDSQDCLSITELIELMKRSNDAEDRLWAWRTWRDVVGRPSKDDFVRYVAISNQLARERGFNHYGEYLHSQYGLGDDLLASAEKILEDIKPQYAEMYALLRGKLHDKYGDEWVDLSGPIQAHLIGDMWSAWDAFDDIADGSSAYSFLVSTQLREKRYTPETIARLIGDYFVSMGFPVLPETFWKNSIFSKPEDGRDVSCVPSTYDFENGEYRILMCADVSFESLNDMFHHFGKVYYKHLMETQPLSLRNANPVIDTALGNALLLSFISPANLKKVGILDENYKAKEGVDAQTNFMLPSVMKSIINMPFAFVVEEWRHGVFNGTITPDRYNTVWWELRAKHEGIIPPLDRTEDDFDPGARFYILGDLPYLKYFLAQSVKFNLLHSMCSQAVNGSDNGLHNCSLSGATNVGDSLMNVMRKGSSVDVTEVVSSLTGVDEIGTFGSKTTEQFGSVKDLVIQINDANGHRPGWGQVLTECPSGWLRYKDSCYKFYDTLRKPQPDAQRQCGVDSFNRIGHLVTIADENENEFLVDTLLGGVLTRAWIGLVNNEGTHEWQTLNSEPLSYTNWKPREPSFSNDDEHCVEINRGHLGLWNDIKCRVPQAFICELELFQG